MYRERERAFITSRRLTRRQGTRDQSPNTNVYIYIYIYTHMYMYIYMCTYIYIYIYTYIYSFLETASHKLRSFGSNFLGRCLLMVDMYSALNPR